ncbi:MAG TPA: hypothetical protein DCF62_05175 [Porticoccaceae bacterium]|nr:hypothetical protein [Porticoccaceae bacterium]HCO60103.1 hypothetical protein [Porticoccaceae bacterium]
MRWFAAVLLLINLLAYYWFGRQYSAVDSVAVSSGVDDEAPSLVLVSELPVAAADASVIAFPAYTGNGTSCWMLGPLDEPSIERLSSEMDAAGLSMSARNNIDTEIEGYWVYLPAQKSELERAAMLKALQADDIDFFVFGNGKLENSVSLGFFKDRDNADQKYGELRAAGYSPVVASTSSLAGSFWVSMPDLTFDLLSKAFWRDMGRLNPTMMVETTGCGKMKG